MQERLRDILEGFPTQNGHNLQPEFGDGSDPNELVEDNTEGPRSKRSKRDGSSGRKTKWEIIKAKVERVIEQKAICPLEGILHEEEVLFDPILSDPFNTVRVVAAIKGWSLKINKYCLRQYWNWYNSSDAPTSLVFSKSKSYFPNFNDSVDSVDNLLRFQFGDTTEEIKQFLTELVNVIDKQPVRKSSTEVNLKNNTFLIHSLPSAGKNFFMDMIFTLLLNMGIIATANKNNPFAFQDIVNRRVIQWNEPNYESALTDYIKTLFEGGDTKVRQKNLPDAHVERTPIVVLTNNTVPFMVDPAFVDRIKQYKWQPAPLLKEHMYKPHPLAFYSLLNKYEIEF